MLLVRRALVVLACLALTLAARAGVFVVGTGPGATHADVQAAVDAASDGDFVLVRSGTYASFVVRNLDLTIAAMPGATVTIDGAIRVSGIAATKTLLLSGLTANGRFTPSPQSSFGLYARNCAGSLRVQDCRLTAGIGQGPCGLRADGAYVENCADVVITRCVAIGASQFFDWFDTTHLSPYGGSGMGLAGSNSTIAMYECDLRGGMGEFSGGYICSGYGYTGYGGGGGDGALLENCFVFANFTAFTGQRGGDGAGGSCEHGGRGGDGLHLRGPSPGMLFNCTTVAGQGGWPGGGFGCGPYFGPNGRSYYAPVAPAPTVVSGTLRRMTAPSVVPDGSATSVTFQGAATESLRLLMTRETRQRFMPSAFGVRVPWMQPPFYYGQAGVIPANGALTQSWTIPLLPPGERAQRWFLQPIFVSAAGSAVLGTPQAIVVVDHTL